MSHDSHFTTAPNWRHGPESHRRWRFCGPLPFCLATVPKMVGGGGGRIPRAALRPASDDLRAVTCARAVRRFWTPPKSDVVKEQETGGSARYRAWFARLRSGSSSVKLRTRKIVAGGGYRARFPGLKDRRSSVKASPAQAVPRLRFERSSPALQTGAIPNQLPRQTVKDQVRVRQIVGPGGFEPPLPL